MVMPIGRFRLPDGSVAKFRIPEGMTEDDARAQVEEYFARQQPEQQEQTAGEYISKTITNIPGSAKRFAGGLVHAAAHPIDTAKNVLDVAAGGLRNVMPDRIRSAIDEIDPNRQAAVDASEKASAVGQFYKDRYGGLQNIAETIQTDPVGFAADASAVLGLGAGAARVAGLSPVAKALSTASKYTNPMTPVIGAAKIAGKGLGAAVGELGTHTGKDSIYNAYASGKAGGDVAKTFTDNMRRRVPMESVLKDAKSALSKMSDARAGEYAASKAGWKQATQRIDFKPIVDKFDDYLRSVWENGHWKIGDADRATAQEIYNVLREWKNDPSMHTVVGMDALKQRLNTIYPASEMHRQGQRAVATMSDAVKAEIVKRAPAYAKAMADYEKSISLQREIERALSLGDRASADAALRKLQSITRNNAYTNYGNRVAMLKELEGSGGKPLMPAIAGQSLTAIAPRGLGRLVASANVGAATQEPWLAALLPVQSPRAMGEVAYYAGKASNVAGPVLDPRFLLYAGQGGLLSQIGQD